MITAETRPAHYRAIADLLEAHSNLQPIDVTAVMGTRAFAPTADDALRLMQAIGGTWKLGESSGSDYVYFVGSFAGEPIEISLAAAKAFGIAPSRPELLPELAEVVSET